MDWTPLQHALIALACAGIGWLLGNPVAGAAFGVALFIGREHAQNEYSWIERWGAGKRGNMPWWGGFDVYNWTISGLLDWLVPLVVVGCVVFCLQRFGIVHS